MSRLALHRQTAAVLAVLSLAALLAACGGGANAGGAASAGASSVPATGGGGASGPSAAPGNQLIVDQRSIVKTGELTLEVENVANALARVRSMAQELGGYVGGAQAGSNDESATLTLRLPAPRFDEALARLHELAVKVIVEQTREEDVTATVVDLQARLKNLQASEAQYRLLVGRATKIDDILAVQSRLDQVQGQIEEISAQLKNVTNQADLSTLTVTLQPSAQTIKQASADWDPGANVSAAAGTLLQIGEGVVTVAIWLGIVVLPIGLVLAVIWFALLRLGVIRRVPATPEA